MGRSESNREDSSTCAPELKIDEDMKSSAQDVASYQVIQFVQFIFGHVCILYEPWFATLLYLALSNTNLY